MEHLFGPDHPGRSYTIDDLPMLIETVETDVDWIRWAGLLAVLADPQETERALRAQRRPGALIGQPAPSEKARHCAEMMLAEMTEDERTLRVLALSDFREVRVEVASNPETPRDVLMGLAWADDAEISYTAAAHHALGEDDLQLILVAGHDTARMGALANPNLAPAQHTALAADPCADVRAGAAWCPAATPAQHHELAGDPDEHVRLRVAQATRDRALLGRLAADAVWYVREAVAVNPGTGRAALAVLARDADDRVRRAVARRPRLDPDLAIVLAGDPVDAVRAAAAANPATPAPLLRRLASTRNTVDIREAVAGNPACPGDLRSRLASRDRSPSVRACAQRSVR